MLYDEGIRSLEKAEEAFIMDGPDRIEKISNSLLHAQDVITELAISLDFDKGGEIAQNLHRLYDFMINHLSHANVKKDLKAVQDVRKMLGDLKEAWVEVAKKELPREPSRVSPMAAGIRISG
jgi:flagellar protein FliS